MEQEVEGQIQAIKEGKASSSNLKSFLSGCTISITPAQLPLRSLPCITVSCSLKLKPHEKGSRYLCSAAIRMLYM